MLDANPDRDTVPPMVPLFDLDESRVVRVPAAELTCGAARIRIRGVEGPVWAIMPDAWPYLIAWVKHPPLSEAWRARVAKIRRGLRECYHDSQADWEKLMRSADDPAGAIAAWSHFARLYQVLARHELSAGRRGELAYILWACMHSTPGVVPLTLSPAEHTRDEALAIVRRFFETAPAPSIPNYCVADMNSQFDTDAEAA